MSTVQDGDLILPTITTQNARYGSLVMGKDSNEFARFLYINSDGSLNVSGDIGITNISGTQINPATEEKQDDIISALGGQNNYDILVDDYTTNNITYIGKAQIGTSTSTSTWQIKRLNETSTYLEIGYADSDSNFDNIWDNRVSLNYSK